MMIGTGGYQVINYLYRIRIKSEMKAYLHVNQESNFTNVLHFKSVNNVIEDQHFEWVEMGKEFIYNGSMYDIVKMEHHLNTSIVYCINDKAENRLKRTIASIHQKLNSPISNARMNIQKIFSALYDINTITIKFENLACLAHNSFVYQDDLIKRAKDLLKPPPELTFG